MTSSPYLVGLVGQGVGPSLTPELHMAEGRAHGLDYVYRTIDLDAIGVTPERIGEVWSWARALGFNALNVTHPCKRLVIPHLDALDHDAAALGAVNTVVFEENGMIGYNTDAPGFATGFDEGLPGAVTKSVTLVGAGGAGRPSGMRCSTSAPSTSPSSTSTSTERRHWPVTLPVATPTPGSTRRRSTNCRYCCRPATASCTALPPECWNIPALRSIPRCCTPVCGWPTSSTAHWTRRC